MEEQEQKTKRNSNFAIIVAIVLGAWIIGMSIIVAGWLISKEVGFNSDSNSQAKQVTDGNAPAGRIDIEVPETAPVLGDENAPVTIIEFADYQCPYCAEFYSGPLQSIKRDYVDSGKVKFTFIDFAILGESSVMASEAAYCAKDQDKYWEYHNNLFDNSLSADPEINERYLIQIAEQSNLQIKTFSDCLSARLHKPVVEQYFGFGDDNAVNSTPTVFINGIRLVGVKSYGEYKAIIEHELSKISE